MSKYHAKATEVDGIRFHSQKEARRYQELRLLEKAGEIRDIRCQHALDLYVETTKIGRYIADFSYVTSHGQPVMEDVKGFKTPLYKWKKRHVEAQYGVQILET